MRGFSGEASQGGDFSGQHQLVLGFCFAAAEAGLPLVDLAAQPLSFQVVEGGPGGGQVPGRGGVGEQGVGSFAFSGREGSEE